MKKLTIDEIKYIVSNHIDLGHIHEKTNKWDVVFPRQVLHYFCRIYATDVLRIIGKNCGGRDHSTVLHSYKHICNLYDTERPVRGLIDAIRYDLDRSIPDEAELINFCLNGSNYDIHRAASFT